IDDVLSGLGMNRNSLPTQGALGVESVYMGKQRRSTGAAANEYETLGKRGSGYEEVDLTESLAKARSLPVSWSQDEMDNFIRQGVIRKIPGFSMDMGLDQVLDKWDDMVTLSSKLYANGQKVSPSDIMNSYKSREGQTVKRGNWEYDAVTGEPVKYVGPTSKTSTSTRCELATREEAVALAKNSMAQLMGRMPTNEELASYMNLLNGYERANPTTSTTTSQISSETGEEVSSSTTSTGGVTQAGRQALLEEKMRATPESGAYQAATTYMSALMETIMRGY